MSSTAEDYRLSIQTPAPDATISSFTIVSTHSELQALLRKRAEALKLSRRTLDDVSGLASGYCEKILSDRPTRNIGPVSLFPIVGALGLSIALIEDPHAMRRIEKLPKRDEGKVRGDTH